ncbi:XrtA system polysaccharide chain length determinant [Thioalkalivibrio sp.]|uniref:XrtA system polysaccharide chain length determinant n=1 Tax=Thioalkalivibrio sp. TaxID=2093813 RepID=UPI00397538B7
MEKIVQELWQHVRATWRKRWWILPIAWLVCLGGWAYAHNLPDTYQADARVYVNTQSVLDPLLRGMTVRPNTEQRLLMITRTLFSRDNLEEIARESDLDVLTGNSDLDAQVALLRARLTLDVGERDNIYSVHFRHGNPEVAYRVVRETVDLFMARGMGDSRLDLTTSQAFIERQLEKYEQQLQEKEAEIEQFKRDNARFISGDGNFYSRMERTRDQLQEARLQKREAQSRLQTLVRRAGSGPGSHENAELDQRISDLQQSIDSMRLRYTDEHPDLVSSRRILEELEARREQETQNPQATQRPGSGNEVLQNAISETESEIASLTTRIAEFEDRVARLEGDVEQAPAVESDLTSLTRNYDVMRNSYRQLQDRREQAVMSGAVESQTDAVDFRVLEPPRQPTAPASPDRPMLATAVLLVGLGAGTGFAFLLSQLHRTISSSQQLATVTGRPVLGSVSRVRTPMSRHRRLSELTVFTAALGTLVLVYAVVMGLYATGSEALLDDLLGLLG